MKQSTKFEKAKVRVEKLFVENATADFFLKNFINLNCTVAIYNTLKRVYKDNKRELDYYEDFEKTFSKFYSIGRFVSPEFIQKYYKMLNTLRDKTEFDVRELTIMLKDGENIQFSFTTKILNIMNDEKYPIYDSYVARAFGLYSDIGKDESVKIDKYVENYTIIIDTYKHLLLKYQCVMKEFKIILGIEKDELSDMRIIDIIIWQIGEKLINKKIEI